MAGRIARDYPRGTKRWSILRCPKTGKIVVPDKGYAFEDECPECGTKSGFGTEKHYLYLGSMLSSNRKMARLEAIEKYGEKPVEEVKSS